jgi:hypothetical protein
MNNKDLITQYVGTGIGIPRYQFDKLSNNNKTSYLKKMEISIKHNARNIQYYYGELPEDVQLAAVKQNPFAIRGIDNPSPEVQLAAVNQNANAIMNIDNPTPEVQLAAVKQNPFAIRGIDNPSPEVQMAAVKQDEYAIRRIDNPSPEALALYKKLYGG